jgi:CheY-like chemotaxis protein
MSVMPVTRPWTQPDPPGQQSATPGAAIQSPSPSDTKAGSHPADTTSAAHRPLRVLVVDDHPDTADGLVVMLGLIGAEGRAVYDGETALTLLSAFVPDLILLDIGMPGLDGYDVARLIRSYPGFERVPLVAVSGWTTDDDRRRGVEAGFDVYLAKPLDLNRVRSLLVSLGLQGNR